MTMVGWLPAPVEDLFGTEATAEESYEVLTVDVPPASWLSALEVARTRLTCTYFDWLSAVDEPGTGFRVAAHVVALSPVRRLLLRTTVPHEAPVLPSAVGVFAGAAWHERETHEMFGVDFEDHPALDHLLLPEGFEGHPLRKDFVLAARVAKAWPGAKEPGESEHGGPKRRQMLPPGVPDPNEWGPLKGQLPPAPARPARGAGRAAGERPARAAGERPVRAAGDRPVRRARSVSEGSASQAGASSAEGQEETSPTADAPAAPGAQAGPRRARSAVEGSASQQARTDTGAGAGTDESPDQRARSTGDASAPQRTESAEVTEVTETKVQGGPAAPDRTTAPDGPVTPVGPVASAGPTTPLGPMTPPAPVTSGDSAVQSAPDGPDDPVTPADSSIPADPSAPAGPRRTRSASDGSGSRRAQTSPAKDTPTRPSAAPRSSDAPWHHARPASEEPKRETEPERKPEDRKPEDRKPHGEPSPAATEDRSATEQRPTPKPGRPATDPIPIPATESVADSNPATDPSPATDRDSAAEPTPAEDPRPAAAPEKTEPGLSAETAEPGETAEAADTAAPEDAAEPGDTAAPEVAAEPGDTVEPAEKATPADQNPETPTGGPQ
ncbi:NADH-quinone oxidoreductase subunit C [Streptomyces sp. ALI-76-A]|uniref:NADH-quinone oxidoreductase subunit C n=1 Tax=Streptomyces sp. ALI-76-A TaxID=3025736 RepID=UPI00256F03E7|nr:NADH-quinone oxidoreductase subunit C [Streptomyces sp. ALI-76-A]MDL5203171.1 NADH-quinone oxidoreductase subunit C [Streptomyces sp. ALI-76-A]